MNNDPSTLTKPKILLIDDDVFFTELVKDILCDYQVEVCLNAVEAFERLDQIVPLAIILDLLMPGATGLSLMQELASHDNLNQIPLIVCSSIANEVDEAFLRAAGAKIILDKTKINPRDLVLSLKRLGL